MSWTEAKKDMETGQVIQFEGDSREFTPHAVNTMRSRVEQEVVVDFIKKKCFHMRIRVLRQKITNPDGSVNKNWKSEYGKYCVY